MAIDDSAAQDALDGLISSLNASTSRVSLEMADTVQRAARNNLTNPLGPLAESIMVTGPDNVGTFRHRSQTGPTLVYGRQRELGGHIDPINDDGLLTAHYRDPGYWMWEGRDVFTPHVFQVGQHYLKRGVEESLPELLRVARRIWGQMFKVIS